VRREARAGRRAWREGRGARGRRPLSAGRWAGLRGAQSVAEARGARGRGCSARDAGRGFAGRGALGAGRGAQGGAWGQHQRDRHLGAQLSAQRDSDTRATTSGYPDALTPAPRGTDTRATTSARQHAPAPRTPATGARGGNFAAQPPDFPLCGGAGGVPPSRTRLPAGRWWCRPAGLIPAAFDAGRKSDSATRGPEQRPRAESVEAKLSLLDGRSTSAKLHPATDQVVADGTPGRDQPRNCLLHPIRYRGSAISMSRPADDATREAKRVPAPEKRLPVGRTQRPASTAHRAIGLQLDGSENRQHRAGCPGGRRSRPPGARRPSGPAATPLRNSLLKIRPRWRRRWRARHGRPPERPDRHPRPGGRGGPGGKLGGAETPRTYGEKAVPAAG
jgi:hypothetical protein